MKQNNTVLLDINKLDVRTDQKKILKEFNLKVFPNELHVIMGPNGCGKSTLSKVLAGHPSYSVTNGSIFFNGTNLLTLSPEQRSHHGLFLAFQYPVEISGVTNYDFLRIAYNEKQKFLQKKELDPLFFMEHLQVFLKELKMKDEFLFRNLNESFSGGEKKRNEILQMLLLQPKLTVLDEIDSGLDIDAIKLICKGIRNYLQTQENKSLLLITHYPRLLTYLSPTHVHIMNDGKIQQSGGSELVETLEKSGYQAFSKN